MKPSLGISHTESGSSELRKSPRLLGMSNPGSGICPSALRRTRMRGMSNPERESSQFALRKSTRLLALRKSTRLLGNSAISTLKSPAKGKSAVSTRKSPAKGKSAISTRNSPVKGNSAISILKSPAKGKSAISARKSPAKGKSAMTMPEHSQISTCKPRKNRAAKGHGANCRCRGAPNIETLMRINREHEAKHFRRNYIYRYDCLETKTCIHPGGDFSWEDKSSGFTWVAVRGRHATCVVFKKTLEHVKDRLQRSYLRYSVPEITYKLFGLTAISEIEVLADLPSGSNQRFEYDGRVRKPFAIVSVDPSNPNDPVKDEGKEAAVEYLKSVLTMDKDYVGSETLEIAIRAFQLLYDEKFEAGDIWVSRAFLGDDSSLSWLVIKRCLRSINQPGEKDRDDDYLSAPPHELIIRW